MKRFAVLMVLLPAIMIAGTITQTFTFSPNEVTFTKVNGYDLAHLREDISTSQPGSPIIPQIVERFLVPATATVIGVEVVNSSSG